MIVGRYVETFDDADMGMLEGASLNAPYAFHWVFVKSVAPDQIICTGAGKEMRLPRRKVRGRDSCEVVVQDPIFGPTKFQVLPFKQDAAQ